MESARVAGYGLMNETSSAVGAAAVCRARRTDSALRFTPIFGLSLLLTSFFTHLTLLIDAPVELVDGHPPRVQLGELRQEVPAHCQGDHFGQAEMRRFRVFRLSSHRQIDV